MSTKHTKINLEKRTAERRAKLIEQCRYFKDDMENPWMYCYNPTLIWRKDMWELEKEWVEALSCRYRSDLAKHDLIDSLYLTGFAKAKGIPTSLMNHIFKWVKEQCDKDAVPFRTSDAAKVIENYIMRAPLARDFRMYFAYYMGDEYDIGDVVKEHGKEELYESMGYTQECLMKDGSYQMYSDWYYADKAKEHRGEEGIWGWYADSKFPSKQKDVVYFICCNWGLWCPGDDVDGMAEQYLFYHYPGDDKLKGTEYGDEYYEDSDLLYNSELAAVKIAREEFGKDTNVELYQKYDDHCYFRPLLSYIKEQEYQYPVLIKVEYARYEASILCNEESKTINDEIQAYKRKCAIEQSCIFYKGEDNNPFPDGDWKNYQWQYEQMWVWNEVGATFMDNPHIMEFIMDFPDSLSFDTRPTSFKAMLYNYLTLFNDGYPDEKELYRKWAKDTWNKIVEYKNTK